jgi:hypothetical protein
MLIQWGNKMVRIDHRILITAILCLTTIEIVLVISNHDSQTLHYAVVGTIGLMAGIVLPSPKINNKSGVLKW